MEQQQQHVNEEESRFVFGDLVPLNLSSIVELVQVIGDTLRSWILVFLLTMMAFVEQLLLQYISSV